MQLLIADPRWTWRDWLKENLGDRELVCLDVANADFGPPGRVFIIRDGKVRKWRLVGSVYANRNTVDLLVGTASLLKLCETDAVVLSFEARESPVLRQMAIAVSESCGASQVLVPEGSAFLHEHWPVEPSAVPLAESLPLPAQIAHRRSRWLEMVEQCQEHTVELDHVGVYGVRLGSGQRLHGPPFDDLGVHVEVYGQTLLVVTDHEPEAQTVGEALNLAHASKLHLVSPTAYNGLVSSFVRGSGEDFGIGVVKSIDFEKREATFYNTAVAPAPVRTVRIGSVRIDDTGKETGEIKPWAV